MAAIGDTFLLADAGINSHLFIVISDPGMDANRVVTANFTSWRQDKDPSCVVERGAHPYLSRRSCVDYRTQPIQWERYLRFLASGAIRAQAPVSGELLRAILQGAAVSRFIPLGNRQILVEQGLIDQE